MRKFVNSQVPAADRREFAFLSLLAPSTLVPLGEGGFMGDWFLGREEDLSK